MFLLAPPLQGSVLHQGDRRGPPLPGQPYPGPHPEQDRVLPDEHPRAAAHHLPVSTRREHRQPGGPSGRRRRAVAAGQAGQDGLSTEPQHASLTGRQAL